MQSTFNRDVSAADDAYRTKMKLASNKLAEAVWLAKRGINPDTPLFPAGLPADYTDREGPKPDNRYRNSDRRPSNEVVAELMAQGKRSVEIAEALGISYQKASAIMKLVRRRKQLSDADIMRKKALWG